MDLKNLISRIELAAALAVEPQTIAKWQRLGLFPHGGLGLAYWLTTARSRTDTLSAVAPARPGKPWSLAAGRDVDVARERLAGHRHGEDRESILYTGGFATPATAAWIVILPTFSGG